MALPNPPRLTTSPATVTFEVTPGREYLLVIRGNYAGNTVAFQYVDPHSENAQPDWVTPENGTFSATRTEGRFRSPHAACRLSMSGGTTASLSIALTPLTDG